MLRTTKNDSNKVNDMKRRLFALTTLFAGTLVSASTIVDTSKIPTFQPGDQILAADTNGVNAELVRAIESLNERLTSIENRSGSLPMVPTSANGYDQCTWALSGIEVGLSMEKDCHSYTFTYNGEQQEGYTCPPASLETGTREGTLILKSGGVAELQLTRNFIRHNRKLSMDGWQGLSQPPKGTQRFEFLGRDSKPGDLFNTVFYNFSAASTVPTWSEDNGVVTLNVPDSKEMAAHTVRFKAFESSGTAVGEAFRDGRTYHDPDEHGLHAIHMNANRTSCSK